jgi:uncharacterized protein (TIGR03118 family)
MFTISRKRASIVVALALAGAIAVAEKDSRFKVTNLVSDIPGLAPILDPNSVNPWGIALNPAGGAFWVSNTGTSTSTLYAGDVNGSAFVKVALVVTIPGGVPTGQVFNGSSDFVVTNGASSAPARFITAGLSGVVTGWSGAIGSNTLARIGVTTPGAVYTGLAIGNDGTRNLLYAADTVGGKIDVFDGTYAPTNVPGMFIDPNLPPGLTPFNIQNLGGRLFVTYENFFLGDVEGNGVVNEFDMNGYLIRRVTSNDSLMRPWGLAIAPANFGSFSNALLVGNFGDGRIHAFRMSDGKKLGAMKRNRGGPIEIERLWGLQFGNGVSAGNPNDLYFAAGIEEETHGLFGKIEVD